MRSNNGIVAAMMMILISSSVSANTWSSCAPMPTSRMDAASAVMDDTLYVMGGRQRDPGGEEGGLVDVVEAYTASDNVWHTGYPSLPESAAAQACAVLGGRIYLFGGIGGEMQDQILDVMWSWRPGETTWRIHSSTMPYAVHAAGAAAHQDGGILLIGGLGNAGQVMSDVYRFVPGVGFEEEASLDQGRSGFGIGVRLGDVLAVGGFFHGPLASTEIYSHGAWFEGPELPEPRGGHLVCTYDNQVIVIGGLGVGEVNTDILDDVNVLSDTDSQWFNLPPLLAPRARMAGGIIEGYIVVAGGVTSSGGQSLNSAERIPLALNAPFDRPPMPELSLHIYPNPVSKWCTISASASVSAPWTLSVHGIDGRLIWRHEGHMSVPETHYRPEASQPDGIYLATFSSGEIEQTAAFILLR